MWWALVVWDERPSTVPAALFAIFGVAAFLSWPVWVGPVMVVLAVLALLHGDVPLLTRLQHLSIAAVPIGCVAAIHGLRHTGGFRMAGTGGFAIWPTPALLGWWFIALAAAGSPLLHGEPAGTRGAAAHCRDRPPGRGALHHRAIERRRRHRTWR